MRRAQQIQFRDTPEEEHLRLLCHGWSGLGKGIELLHLPE